MTCLPRSDHSRLSPRARHESPGSRRLPSPAALDPIAPAAIKHALRGTPPRHTECACYFAPSRVRRAPVQPLSRDRLTCRLVAAVLILLAAAARLVYLARDCPLDLAPDEAHYWDW